MMRNVPMNVIVWVVCSKTKWYCEAFTVRRKARQFLAAHRRSEKLPTWTHIERCRIRREER